jgi:hypothetical protein
MFDLDAFIKSAALLISPNKTEVSHYFALAWLLQCGWHSQCLLHLQSHQWVKLTPFRYKSLVWSIQSKFEVSKCISVCEIQECNIEIINVVRLIHGPMFLDQTMQYCLLPSDSTTTLDFSTKQPDNISNPACLEYWNLP